MTAKVIVGDKVRNIQIEPNQSLYTSLVENGLLLIAPCAGNGRCGKCKAKLISADFPVEVDKDGNFLTCKCFPKGDITIQLSDVFVGDFELLGASRSDCSLYLDLGTTTLCFTLVNNCGASIGKITLLNPQQSIGADVITRITYCRDFGVNKAQKLILGAISYVLSRLKELDYSIKNLIVCGNTTMIHILHGISPSSIGTFPFTPQFLSKKEVSGSELGLKVDKVKTLPLHSAYIGSDVIAGSYFTQRDDKCSILLDLGTNGEIVLSFNGKKYCTSTSAGPALEGGCIECGTGSVSGAIKKIIPIGLYLRFLTIRNYDPIGLCGSGLVSLIAFLLKKDLLDSTGKLVNFGTGIKDEKFYVAPDIYLTQKDVREFQLAKSAIRTAIDILLEKLSIDYSMVEKVYLAGGLGEFCEVGDLVATGILPSSLKDKCESVGNAAIKGSLSSCTKEFITFSEDFKNTAQYVELSMERDFNEKFIKNLNF